MHEMAIVRDVLAVALKEADKAHAGRVKSVTLRIGEGRDIVSELFCGLFEHLARGTQAEGAEIVLQRVPMTTRCKACGKLYRLNVHDESTWPCPACGSRDYELFSGMEFTMERLELADFDENASGQPAA